MMFKKYISVLNQFIRFGVVGLIAASIHFVTVVYLVKNLSLVPLKANIFAFLIAFLMSYLGHTYFTFKGQITTHANAFPKLLLVQIINFSANECLFFLFLSLHFPYQIALMLTLTILPLFTFALSKQWVYRSPLLNR